MFACLQEGVDYTLLVADSNSSSSLNADIEHRFVVGVEIGERIQRTHSTDLLWYIFACAEMCYTLYLSPNTPNTPYLLIDLMPL